MTYITVSCNKVFHYLQLNDQSGNEEEKNVLHQTIVARLSEKFSSQTNQAGTLALVPHPPPLPSALMYR